MLRQDIALEHFRVHILMVLVNLVHDSLTGYVADLSVKIRHERAPKKFVMRLDIIRVQRLELFLLTAVIVRHFLEMISDPCQSFQTADAGNSSGEAV